MGQIRTVFSCRSACEIPDSRDCLLRLEIKPTHYRVSINLQLNYRAIRRIDKEVDVAMLLRKMNMVEETTRVGRAVDSIVLSGARQSCFQAHISIVRSGAKYRAIRRTQAQKSK